MPAQPDVRPLAIVAGSAAALVLVAPYTVLVSIANPPHALGPPWGDRYFVAAIATGFGVQAGLYACVRRVLANARAARSSGAIAAAGTGASTAAMVAGDGAAVFLNDYQVQIMLGGLALNAAGIVVLLGVVRSTRARVLLMSRLVAGGNM